MWSPQKTRLEHSWPVGKLSPGRAPAHGPWPASRRRLACQATCPGGQRDCGIGQQFLLQSLISGTDSQPPTPESPSPCSQGRGALGRERGPAETEPCHSAALVSPAR